MTAPVIIGDATMYCGDSLEVLKALPENSIEACLTDPPYGLSSHSEADIRRCMAAWLAGKPYQHGKAGFMGRDWDSFVPGPELWRELYRVLKPGAHLLVFAGTRTADLMSLALRLAGFECRDCLMWISGQGFPKALDLSKKIDELLGAEREVVGEYDRRGQHDGCVRTSNSGGAHEIRSHVGAIVSITAPATPEAAQWEGWKSALKPAYEPILLFRKPLDGTIAETALKWGTGGLNVGATRVGTEMVYSNGNGCGGLQKKCKEHGIRPYVNGMPHQAQPSESLGRYPSHLIVDSSAEVEGCFPIVNGSGDKRQQINPAHNGYQRSGKSMFTHKSDFAGYHDSGSASRFFQHCDFTIEEIAELHGIEARRLVYSGKASKRDRDEGCEGMEERESMDFIGSGIDGRGNTCETQPRRNHHPTCKPSSLLRYLLKLICPPGCTVIDPFFGSGSTGKAALLEGFRVIGIEREPEYFEIAQARVAHVSPEAFTVKASVGKVAMEPAQGMLL